MDTLLFSERSIWTMLHGIVLGGGAMMGLAAALYTLVETCKLNNVEPQAYIADVLARATR